MSITLADLPELELRLADAKLGLHKILTGKSKIYVAYTAGGMHSASFQQASVPELRKYILEMQADVARLKGDASPFAPIHWS